MKNPLIEPLEARIAPATLSILTPATFQEGDTGTQDLMFRVMLTGDITENVTVHFATSNGTATVADNDYTAASGTLTFAPGDTEKFIPVPIKGDTKREADETFTVTLDTPTGDATLDPAMTSAVGTIENDDPVPTVSIGDFAIVEGDSGTKNAVFTLTLSNPAATVVRVTATTADDTATAGSDYASTTTAILFTPGTTTRTFTVPISTDLTREANETFFVNLTNEANAIIGVGQGRGTITNDDPLPTISIDDLTTTEGNTGTKNAVFNVRLTNPSSEIITVVATAATDTATQGGDFTATSQTVTFMPGETLRTFTVPILGDATDESDETFFVNLTDPSASGVLGDMQAVGKITNDDISVLVGNVAINETNGETTLTFNVTLSGPANHPVTVDFATADDTAVSTGAGADFDARSGTLTFDPGVTTLPVIITVHGDMTDEANENFFLNLTNVTNALLTRAQATGTIQNDDSILRIENVRIAEGGPGGAAQAVFQVTLANPSVVPISVKAATADGTATAGSDYAAKMETLTFNPGETMKTFTVPIIGDLVDENEESFFVNLTEAMNATLSTPQVTGTILNDDLRVRVEDVSIVEGNAGDTTLNFLVQLSTTSNHGVTVNFETQDGTAISTNPGADFEARMGTLTFAPGQTSLPVSITVRGDLVGEVNENFFLKLTGATNAVISRAMATGTITNDDAGLRISDAQVFEGGTGSTTDAVFTVTLENGPATGNVTVEVMTMDGDATTADGDYTATATTTLTFLPGETTKTVRVPVLGDVKSEQNETFLVKLANPSANATLARDTGTGTILNDDGLVFTINDVTVTEGDNGTVNAIFLVRMLSAPNQSVSVNVTTGNGTATSDGANPDFNSVTQTLTFTGSQTQQLVQVPIRGDLIKEGTEMFSVFLSGATAGATILQGEGLGTILDNNDPTLTVSIGSATLVEGNGGTSLMIFEVTLSQPADGVVTASFATQDGSGAQAATVANGDYSAVANGTVRFDPGQTNATIAIPINGDTTDESDETFGVTLSNPSGATLGTASATGTIQNDEVTISIGDFTMVEGNGGTTTFIFQVSLNQTPAGHSVTVNYATADDAATSTGANADYVTKSGSLTFAAGSAVTQTVSITVNGDARFEGNERFFVNLLAPVNATLADGQGAGTITNDDAAPKISILDPASLTEGNTEASEMTFTVQLDKASDLPVTVNVNTMSGSALAGSDFTAVTDQLITFAPGERSKTVTVQIVGDGDDEPTENFAVQLSDATNAGLDRATATGTILDNDLRTVSITDVSVVEGNTGTTKVMTFNVTLSQAAKQTVTVDFTTASGSAFAGQDFEATSGTLTFAPNATTRSVMVTINGDATVEGNERLFLNLSNVMNGLFDANTRQGKGNIVDDEGTVKLVAMGPATVDEEAGVNRDQTATVKFEVVREGDLSQPVSVQFMTVEGSAKSTGPRPDFTAQTGTIQFAAGSATASAIISVPIIKDLNYENSETFQVRLFNPVNAAVLDNGVPDIDGNATATITDNDIAPTVSILDARLTEGTRNAAGQLATMDFTVQLSAANERDADVTVQFATMAGSNPDTSARQTQAGNLVQDYQPQNNILHFRNGATEQTISVTVLDDTRDELDDEFFLVKLSDQRNGSVANPDGISRAEAFGTITDNDAAPTLSFGASGGNVSVTEGDAGMKNATFTLRLSAVSERPISVQVTTLDDTAVSVAPRPDFLALDHAVFTYTPGDPSSQLTVSVPVFGDTVNEANETFDISLSNPLFAQLSVSSATATITNDDPVPVITVNDVSVVEGESGNQDMIFTVSLSAASDQTVRVDFATADATASASGALADYIATNGTLKFLPGETSKQVVVKVKGDTFKERAETLTLRLADPVNGSIPSPTGTGTILADADSKVGIAINNGFLVEGDSGQGDMTFTVELSDTLGADTDFRIVGTNGTAVRGRDFAFVNAGGTVVEQLTGTIAAGAKSTTVTVKVNGDRTFEATESFFVSLRAVPDGIEVADDAARGTIFNDDIRRVDSHTIQFVDVDGDLATIRLSAGTLTNNNLGFGATNAIGGRQLQFLDLTNNGAQYQDANLTISAGQQTGFKGDAQGVKGDGHVNVGFIRAAIPQGNFQIVNGIDLGTVRIDGDLGKIFVGDIFATSALNSLEVRSMGKFGTETQGTGTALDINSLVLGPVDNLYVIGSMSGSFQVIGDLFGSIKSFHIGDALRGGISFTGKLRTGYIGQIEGGDAANSGALSGSTATGASIGTLVVGGLVSGGAGSSSGNITAATIKSLRIGGLIGGDGAQSGVIIAPIVEKLVVAGNINGGSGANSGEIFVTDRLETLKIKGRLRGSAGADSGSIVVSGGIDKVSIFGGIFGGSGDRSGRIRAGGAIDLAEIGGIFGAGGAQSGSIKAVGSIQQLNVFGNIEGGTGAGSGGVDTDGTLIDAVIGGDLIGGNSRAGASLLTSGYVLANKIGSLYLDGNLEAGRNEGTGLAVSGAIRSETTIGFVRIHGSVLGNEDVAAIIAAPGKGNDRAAIVNLKIDGTARFAEILAGYDTNVTVSNPRGEAINADARITKVKIGGNIQSTSIVAGVEAGSDGLFGTADDVLAGGAGTTDAAKAQSKIAEIIIKGAAQAGDKSAGIVAQFVTSVKVNGTRVPLNSGPGNDASRTTELAAGSNIHVFELPLPS